MNKIENLKIVKISDEYSVRLLKNFYNMLVLNYDYVPGMDATEIFKNVTDSIRENRGQDTIAKGLLYDLKNLFYKNMIKSVNDDNYSDMTDEMIPEVIVEQFYALFDNDNENYKLNDWVIKKAIKLLYSYHPLSAIELYTIKGALRDATNEYLKIQKGGEKVRNLLFTLQEQIYFQTSRNSKHELEFDIYKLMLEVDEQQTKDKLLEEFVKGRICRNDKLVGLFYDLFKDKYESEFDIPLYHGVKPKSYNGKYDLERTLSEYSGCISMSKAKDIALRFTTVLDVPGCILKSVGRIKGLDIERMINEFDYSDSDHMLNNCRNEEEVLVKYPLEYELIDVSNNHLRKGINDYNSTTIDLVNLENNSKNYNRVAIKMKENNFNIFADKIKIVNRHFMTSEEDFKELEKLIVESEDSIVYLIDTFIENDCDGNFKRDGYVQLNTILDRNLIAETGLYDMLINENQIYLLGVEDDVELDDVI